MSLARAFLLCASPALSAVPMAQEGRTRFDSAGVSSGGHGSPALFEWADFDGDERLDLAAASPDGRLQLLANDGEGRFEDVTERVGLAGITNAALALWADYDDDGRLDLFVGAREGTSSLFRNEGGVFVDMSAGSGMQVEGVVRSAHWLDHDGDGRLDLHVVTADRNGLFRGLEGGFFAATELPPIATSPRSDVDAFGQLAPAALGPPSSDSTGSGGLPSAGGVNDDGLRTPTGRVPLGPSSPPFIDPGAVLFPDVCASSIKDQANPGSCLGASTTPALGRLYPISTNLFVAVGGQVGIGTTSPSARLHVAGTARVTDTLTLSPPNDRALEINSGSIYKGGLLFIHTRGGTALGNSALFSVTSGYRNTAIGQDALRFNTSGASNTAIGTDALESNTVGGMNTATGFFALARNTNGSRNTALGMSTLGANTTGSDNTACGTQALYANTTGRKNTALGGNALQNSTGDRSTAAGLAALYFNSTGAANTAVGDYALFSNTTGSRNVAVGHYAGRFLTTGSDNVAIGNDGVAGDASTIRIGTPPTHTRAFIAGIRGATTANANAIPVLVDSAGQLGTVSSSARFKEEIRDMGELTDRLLELRPVVFRYKPEAQAGERPLEYGLIAEEVAEVFPELVVYDDEGEPFTVKYHLLSAMLLNELEKLEARNAVLEHEFASLRARVSTLEEHSGSGGRDSTNEGSR